MTLFNINGNPLKRCPHCKHGSPTKFATNYDLRANAAIEHHSCPACGMKIIGIRNMTDKERRAEAVRILREDERRRVEEAAAAERAARDEAERERERAAIIERNRRGRRG